MLRLWERVLSGLARRVCSRIAAFGGRFKRHSSGNITPKWFVRRMDQAKRGVKCGCCSADFHSEKSQKKGDVPTRESACPLQRVPPGISFSRSWELSVWDAAEYRQRPCQTLVDTRRNRPRIFTDMSESSKEPLQGPFFRLFQSIILLQSTSCAD